jgi:ATP synthase proteolipid subunit
MSPELLTTIGIANALFFSFYGSCMSSTIGGTYLYASPCKDMWKAAIPIVISGVLAIYGLIVAILLAFSMKTVSNDSVAGYKNLAAGLSVGFACFWSGMSMASFLADALYNSPPDVRDEREAASTHVNLNNRMHIPLLSPAFRTRTVTDMPVPVPTVRFCMVLVYLEAIGLYGLIVALLLIAY